MSVFRFALAETDSQAAKRQASQDRDSPGRPTSHFSSPAAPYLDATPAPRDGAHSLHLLPDGGRGMGRDHHGSAHARLHCASTTICTMHTAVATAANSGDGISQRGTPFCRASFLCVCSAPHLILSPWWTTCHAEPSECFPSSGCCSYLLRIPPGMVVSFSSRPVTDSVGESTYVSPSLIFPHSTRRGAAR
jgi:hypothetical protein